MPSGTWQFLQAVICVKHITKKKAPAPGIPSVLTFTDTSCSVLWITHTKAAWERFVCQCLFTGNFQTLLVFTTSQFFFLITSAKFSFSFSTVHETEQNSCKNRKPSFTQDQLGGKSIEGECRNILKQGLQTGTALREWWPGNPVFVEMHRVQKTSPHLQQWNWKIIK